MGAEHSIRRERAAGDAAMAELAGRQHGVVARRQLLELGFGRRAIARRLEAKRLHPLHRGVYAVGHRDLSRRGWWMAAVLACGPGAVLSHRSAAALWGIREGAPTRVDVSVPRELGERSGLRTRMASLGEDEWTMRAGIPATTVPRTLVDLAATLQPHELDRALESAEALRLADATPLLALLERHRGRRGIAGLRRALARGPLRPQLTKSELERRFLALVDRAGLPRPEVNAWIDVAGDLIQVDCLWRRQRVIVELDSRTYHQTAAAFERDRERDRRTQVAGWRPVRVTDRALREPTALVADLRALLSPRAAPALSA